MVFVFVFVVLCGFQHYRGRQMMFSRQWIGAAGLSAALVLGCGNPEQATSGKPAAPSDMLAAVEPTGGIGVNEARKTAEDGSEVVVIGRIGGSGKPFVSAIAAFTIVDPTLSPCPPEEGCETPWDYCCDPSAVKDNIAMVKLVDADGKVLASNAGAVLGVKELATVVVQGTAKRGVDGTLTILSRKVFVRP
jgi:hypothetical protein